MTRLLTTTALVAGVLAFGASAHAHLVYVGPIDLTGTGLGAVDTIMTFATANGQTTAESAQISWDGTKDVLTADPNPPGYTPTNSTKFDGINHTITMSLTGWTPGNGLGIVFNPSEPGGGNSDITLNNLVLTIYGATTGNVLFSAPWSGPLTLDGSGGTGQSGYLFVLDQTETNELNHAGVGANDHVGLLAYATNAQGAHETFFGTVIGVGECDNCVPDPPGSVPEPISIVVFGTGLLGLGIVSRRRVQ